ncbi:hypothetical protein DV737_g3173, partial [Chaetothyriales sp. CBS 132003]
MMPAYSRVAAVTGANKGIGFAIVRQLVLQYPKSSFNSGPLLVYLTARNEQRGRQALGSIRNDQQLREARALRAYGGLTDVEYLPLDIDSQDSIQQFALTLQERHPDGIDILINNAGIALDGFDADVVKKTLHCNYYGTLAATELLLPHIRDGGRVVNVASTVGRLGVGYSDLIRQRFLDAKKTEEVTQLMEDFSSAVAGKQYQRNWPGSAYAVSKAGVIGMTKTIAAATGNRVLINCVCPGYVNTDMTKGRGSRTIDQGAQTPVQLALGDIQGKTGTFWMNGKDISHRWGGN